MVYTCAPPEQIRSVAKLPPFQAIIVMQTAERSISMRFQNRLATACVYGPVVRNDRQLFSRPGVREFAGSLLGVFSRRRALDCMTARRLPICR